MDSPSHLYTSHVAAELLLRPDSHYSTFYEFNGTYLPNWATTLLLGSLNVVFPGSSGERILKTTLPLLFGFALYCTLRGRSPHVLILIPLFYPLIFSGFFGAGFYGFYIGTALCICLLRFLFPHPADVSGGSAIALALMLLAIYYSHLFAFVLGIVFILSSVAVDAVLDAKRAVRASNPGWLAKIQQAGSRGLTCFFWDARWLWLACLPSLLLMVMLLRGSSFPLNAAQVSISHRLMDRLYEATTFTNSFDAISWNWRGKTFTIAEVFVLFAFTLGKWSASSERVWRRDEVKLLVLSGVGIVLFLFSPDKIGEGEGVGGRILYSTFLLMMLFAACHLTRKQAWIVCLAGIMPFALLHQRTVYKTSLALEPYAVQLQESARHIPQCTATLYLPYQTVEPYLSEFVAFTHLDGYLGLQTEVVLLNSYEPLFHSFPLQLRPAFRSPELTRLRDIFAPSKLSILESFVAQYPHHADCVLLWEIDQGSVKEVEKARIREFLSSTFRLIYESRLPAPLYVYSR
jgi:hypothetical protein